MNNLKEREQRILTFMKEEIRLKGYPPTVREICSALGIKSTSTAHKDIANLVKLGYLKKDPSKPRALMIVEFEEDERAYSPRKIERISWTFRRRTGSCRNAYPCRAERRGYFFRFRPLRRRHQLHAARPR